jgi:hypothetical protein
MIGFLTAKRTAQAKRSLPDVMAVSVSAKIGIERLGNH